MSMYNLISECLHAKYECIKICNVLFAINPFWSCWCEDNGYEYDKYECAM